MRKNPREDYRWLEEELLALEEDEPEEETEADKAELQWWEEDEEIRNPGWSVGIYDDEAFDEDAAVIALTPKQKRRQELLERRQKKAEKNQKKKKKKKGIGGLIFLALLELAGILGIIWWWIQWLT